MDNTQIVNINPKAGPKLSPVNILDLFQEYQKNIRSLF